MKLKNNIFTGDFIKSLTNLSSKDLDVKSSYSISKFIKEVGDKGKTYDEQRIKLCEKYGTKNEESGQYDINDKETFEKEFLELLEIEEDYCIEPMKLPAEIKISANDILALEEILILE